MKIINKLVLSVLLFSCLSSSTWKTDARILLTGNNGYINTFEVSTNGITPVNSFDPDGDLGSGFDAGYGIAIRVDTNNSANSLIYYTYQRATPTSCCDSGPPYNSEGVHVCYYGIDGSGGHDIGVIANPDGQSSGNGIQGLSIHNGDLYLLMGGFDRSLHMRIWHPTGPTNGIMQAPITIGPPACYRTNYYGPYENAYAFTVLTNGDFLIQDEGGSPAFREYDKNGILKANGLFIDVRTFDPAISGALGVCMSSDLQSLYFNVGQGIIQTDLSGNVILSELPGPNSVYNIRGISDLNKSDSLTNGPGPGPGPGPNPLPPPAIAQLSPLGYTFYTVATTNSNTLVNTQRVQEVYRSSQFPGAPIVITALRFRPAEYPYGDAFFTTISNIQINLSTTTNGPGALSPTFADNVGTNDTLVYSNALTISSDYTGGDSGPLDSDIIIQLQRPFSYNPAEGNLLLDIRHFSDDSGNDAYISAFNETNDTGSRVVSSNPYAATGFTNSITDEVVFVYYGQKCCVAPIYGAYTASTNASSTLVNTQRVQQVYKALQFPSDPILITELRFRPAEAPFGSDFTNTISDIQINLSTTSNHVDGLSINFSNNVGSDDQIVYSGSLAISSANTGDNSGPRDADIVVHLQNPFAYDPSKGDLLLDIRHFSDDSSNGAYTKMLYKTNDTGSRVLSSDPNASTAAVSDSRVDVVNFVYQGNGSIFGPNYTAYSAATSGSSTFVDALRLQEVYSASQFPPGPIKITELRFRPAAAPLGGAFSTNISSIQFNLSTTTNTPDGLSTIFANNVGADDKVVYSGSLHISSAFTDDQAGPKDTDIVVHLQTPFLYYPSRGNLLLDIRHFSSDTGNGAYNCAFGEGGDGGSRVVGLNPYNTTASFSDTGVDVVNFIYDVGYLVFPIDQ